MDEVAQVIEMATEPDSSHNVIFIIILVLIASVFVLENIKKFKEILGLKNRWEILNDKQSHEIKELKTDVDDVKIELKELKIQTQQAKEQRLEYQQNITDTLKEIRQDMLDNKIENARGEILDFASGVRTRDYNQESYTHIFDLYSKYEKLIKDNGLVNGYVEVSMEYIRKRYAEQLENGFPHVDE